MGTYIRLDTTASSPQKSRRPLLYFGLIAAALTYLAITPNYSNLLHAVSWSPVASTMSDVPLDWDAAIGKAKAAVSKLSLEQKVSLATGIGWQKGPALGNIGPIPEIGFPGLSLQDGPAGLRYVDGASAFGAQINVACTFDRKLMRQRGQDIGAEARGKGVNVWLGPTMNMGRVAAGGRNWESSGGDPYLAGEVAFETIRGVQSQGVQATAKHFIGNEQEHYRTTSSSNIDDRTLHGIYLHPFLRSVQADVASVMTSYNQLNGTYTSEHRALLTDILKSDLGFQGFVQSDWWSQQNGDPSVLAGLDMTMPGEKAWGDWESRYMGKELVQSVHEGKVPESRVNDMATRILTSWYLLKQDQNYPKTNYNSWNLTDDKTNLHLDVAADHGDRIRSIGAASIVLLKNDDVLPFTEQRIPRTVAIIGQNAGDSRYGPQTSGNGGPASVPRQTADGGNEGVSSDGVLAIGWGSGTANFPYLVSPLSAIQQRCRNSRTALNWHLDNEDIEGAVLVAKEASVAVVFIAAASGEGYITIKGKEGDRNDLQAWDSGDELVQAIADVNSNTIVVVHSTGPIIMEKWIDHPNVKAVVWAGLLGQEAGNSVADVLYGDVNPSARLPYTIARRREDYGTEVLYSSKEEHPQIDYTEKLEIDYRHFDQHGIEPRYAFGHGLSYTTFAYSDAQISSLQTSVKFLAEEKARGSVASILHEPIFEVSFHLKNTGRLGGTEIAQLYLMFPAEAQEPRALRGFEAVHLKAGHKARVTFKLSRYSLSIWDVPANIGLSRVATSRLKSEHHLATRI